MIVIKIFESFIRSVEWVKYFFKCFLQGIALHVGRGTRLSDAFNFLSRVDGTGKSEILHAGNNSAGHRFIVLGAVRPSVVVLVDFPKARSTNCIPTGVFVLGHKCLSNREGSLRADIQCFNIYIWRYVTMNGRLDRYFADIFRGESRRQPWCIMVEPSVVRRSGFGRVARG